MTDEVKFIACPAWSLPLIRPDNVRGVCSQCGATLQQRPHNPPDLVRICVSCVAAMAEETGEELTFGMTSETANEVREFLKRQKQ
jgi:hypothetical protein